MTDNTDNTDSWLNFAQLSRDEGGLGLAKHQAAGLVGNLVNESGQGLNPWGPTGDTGTAMGTAQWRGPRLQSLQDYASDNDMDHRTVEAQQAFMRHEFDTTHNKAYKALLAAQDPESAANAVNQYYEISADKSGRRAASARALYDGTDPASVATPANSTPTAGAGTPAAPGALSADETIGPGILFNGSKSGETNKANVIGQALTGMGSALAGISSPAQAAALTGQLTAMQKQNTDGTWSAIGSRDKNGYILMGRKDGTVARVKAGAGDEDPGDIETKKLQAKGAYEKYNDLNDADAKAVEAQAQIAELRKATSNPKVIFGGTGKAAETAKNIMYSLGMNPEGLTDTQAVDRLATQMQLAKGKQLSGAISNYEDQLMSKANGLGLDKSRESNIAALDALDALHAHTRTLAAAGRKYKTDNGKLDDGWDQYRSTFAPPTPAAPPATGPASLLAPGTLPKGVRGYKVISQ